MKKVQEYETILNSIRRIAPEAHIAGGAVRDTIIGKAIRDVDVFMGYERKTDVAAMLRANFKYVKVGEWQQYEMFSDPNIEGVAKFENADEAIPLAIIALKEPLAVLDNLARFDFGVCMAAWIGGEPILTPAFRHDATEKTFTLLRADNKAQYAYSMERYRKLTADRYAGWSLAVPEAFKQLVKDVEFDRHWYLDERVENWLPSSDNLLRPKDRPQCRL